MTKSEALEKIQASVAEGAQLITPKGTTYEAHLEEVIEKLICHMLTPVIANVVSTCAKSEDYEKYKTSKVWAIAKMDNNWLLTLDAENEFALGFGDSAKAIMMHGFSSSDAIGEWCA